MLRWLLRRMAEAFERRWHYDASYLKEIIDISPRAAWMFARATSLGKYRHDVPVAALFAAGDYSGSRGGLRSLHAAGRSNGRTAGRSPPRSFVPS